MEVAWKKSLKWLSHRALHPEVLVAMKAQTKLEAARSHSLETWCLAPDSSQDCSGCSCEGPGL